MGLNPCAIFKLEEDTEVEVIEDGQTYEVHCVAAKEYNHYGESEDHAGLDRLGVDSGYEVRFGDGNAVIPEESVVEIIKPEDL